MMGKPIKIAVIGLGEVGSHYAVGLAAGGAHVCGYSRSINDPSKLERYKPLAQTGVELCSSVDRAICGSALILAVTTSHTALETAQSALPFLASDQIYIELNSAVPSVKQQIAELLSSAADVVDGTTMASVNQLGHKTPVNLSGGRAAEAAELLNIFGMNTFCIGSTVGQASAIKVLRSVFMKGFEAVLVECMQASRRYGVDKQVFDSIIGFFGTKPLPDIMHMLIATDAIHSHRRAEEMTAIIKMLSENDIECTMSKASEEKLNWVSSLGMAEYFSGIVPSDIDPVLDILSRGRQENSL